MLQSRFGNVETILATSVLVLKFDFDLEKEKKKNDKIIIEIVKNSQNIDQCQKKNMKEKIFGPCENCQISLFTVS